VPAVRAKIDRVVQETQGEVEGGLAGIYSANTYATLGVGGTFDSSNTGVDVPATALAVYARNNNSVNDVCAIWGRADALTSYDGAFGGNVIAAAPTGLTNVKLVGLEIDVQPDSGTTCSSSSAGMYINAYNIAIPGPAIQLGSISSGSFNNGLVINGIASTGAGITFNSTNLNYGIYMDSPTYANAAIHLGDLDKIIFNTSGIWANGSNLTFYDPIAGTKTLSQLGTGGGLANIVEDTTPELGGNLYTNAYEIVYNNNKALLMKNTSGTARVGLRLNSWNDWEVGLDSRFVVIGYCTGTCEADPVKIRVGGVNNKQVQVGALDSGGHGYRMLRVPN